MAAAQSKVQLQEAEVDRGMEIRSWLGTSVMEESHVTSIHPGGIGTPLLAILCFPFGRLVLLLGSLPWCYVLSLGACRTGLEAWAPCGDCAVGWVPVAVLIEFRVLLNQEFLAAWISLSSAPRWCSSSYRGGESERSDRNVPPLQLYCSATVIKRGGKESQGSSV